ncbi:arsenite methyltransferase [Candidatus Thorarchaeota archaeon]|nr:MAG: arsenite methyltransferase [Candidatus Thorarchaeota archaeon]
MTTDEIKHEVRKAYSIVAGRGTQSSSPCCSSSTASEESSSSQSSCCDSLRNKSGEASNADCCGTSASPRAAEYAKSMGYDLSEIPNAASGSFAGCGNPVALAGLKQGEVVLDLGSGAGLDAFVAARRVGKTGRVIGVDMTPKMLASARRSAAEMGLANIEFREGDIEDVPVKDNSIDVVISNCVINLAPDKAKVFKESYRVLRPGGRLMVSDIVLNEELSEEDRNNIAKYTGCLAGAILEDKYLNYIRNAGFEKVSVVEKEGWGQAVSARIEAFKPKV